jgi:regulator of protease activity HflC (stomatin/prohibitin superfamily)
MSDAQPSPNVSTSNPYQGVVLVLLGGAVLGVAAAIGGWLRLGNRVVLDAAVALWLAAAMLFEIATRDSARVPRPAREWTHAIMAGIGLGALLVGCLGSVSASAPPSAALSAASAALALAAAGLAASAARYLAAVDSGRFPDGPGLSRGFRVVGWILALAAMAIGLAWAGYARAVSALHAIVVIVVAWTCIELFRAKPVTGAAVPRLATDLAVFRVLGSRANPLASVLDSAQRQLGIDLRSSWALTIVRRSAEPLFIALCVIGWLSSAVTVIGLDEQGILERLGVPLAGAPLAPGLNLHWPWPIDQVARISVRRVETLAVGHEGEIEAGPENVLWARQHGNTEYTLLLGDGRDLIAVDAAVWFRISDPRAWRYRLQNPGDALRAIAYRAVMKATVGRTLAQTLSENVATLTAQLRAMVQADADALGLGVEIVGFTVGGMHPPVMVAGAYQAVGSAQLASATAAIAAQAYRNEIVPAAETQVIARENTARAESAAAGARAAGEAWSFRTLESEVRAEPAEYRYRRRLEAFERELGGRHYTVLDDRIERDGGELWLIK